MKITLQEGSFGTFCLVPDDGQQIPGSNRLDFAGLARHLAGRLLLGVTDGTVDCEHRRLAR